jgi:osmotically-inducible protein OsmY
VIYIRTVSYNPGHVLGIVEAARRCLQNSPYTTLRGVSCKCRHGVLLLTGRLSSFHQKQIAQETVARVQGVTQVVNEIEVGRPD